VKRLLFPLLILLLASCSGTPPRIHTTDWMPVYTKDLSRGGVYEELDFFIRLEDEDGQEDISEISIHKDDRGWAWKLNEENWTSLSKDGELWMGASGLSRDGGIPEGEYRLRVTDRSGQHSETLFEYTSPSVEARSLRFPLAIEAGEDIRIDGFGREPLLLWFYNGKGDFVGERYLAPGLYSRDELLPGKKGQKEALADWFMIYFRDEEGGYGLKSGPFLLNEIPGEPAESSPGQAPSAETDSTDPGPDQRSPAEADSAGTAAASNPQVSASVSATSEDS
jgi:hypothetical protein